MDEQNKRLARALMANPRAAMDARGFNPHEPTQEQMNPSDWQTSLLQQLGGGLLTGGAGMAMRGLSGGARAAPTAAAPYQPKPRSPGYTPMEVGNVRQVSPEETMDALRMIINGGR